MDPLVLNSSNLLNLSNKKSNFTEHIKSINRIERKSTDHCSIEKQYFNSFQ